jgi:hypothetical protein
MWMHRLVMVAAVLALGWASALSAPPKGPPALDADKLAPGVFTGTIVSTPDKDRLFTLNVIYQKLQLRPGQNLGRSNANLQRQYNHIVQLQNQLMNPGRHRNPIALMQQLQNTMVNFQVQAAQAEAKLFQVVTATQKVEFQAEENVKVRIKDLPEDFDDKGNIRKYTREEQAELKGKDKNLPGYESTIDALKVGQIVEVTLRAHKKARPAASPSTSASKNKDADSDKDKEPEKESTNQHKMQVKMIVILKDGSSSGSKTSPSANKK